MSKATYAIKLTIQGPQTTSAPVVVGVDTAEIRDGVIADIEAIGAELIGDWYWFREDDDIEKVIAKAKKLDQKAVIFKMNELVTSNRNIEQAGKYAVLFYVHGGPYILIATHLEKEKKEIESFISTNLKDYSVKENDWYWVNEKHIDEVKKYALRREIQGIPFYLS